MSIQIATTRAKRIADNTFLDVKPIQTGGGFIARFKTDVSLRPYGQALIQDASGAFGIVISPDGTIPSMAEADRLLMPHLYNGDAQ